MTREEAQAEDVVGKAEVIIAKQRNGPVGEVKLHWRPEYTRFEQLSARAHDEFERYGPAEGDS